MLCNGNKDYNPSKPINQLTSAFGWCYYFSGREPAKVRKDDTVFTVAVAQAAPVFLNWQAALPA
jgi:hypothetical protein